LYWCSALTLGCFIASKEILIDAVGWGDLLLGVVIGALKPPNPMLMERRIPISSFQPPNFKNKKYFDDAVKIADEIIVVMQPDKDTCFKVCSEYVLSEVCKNFKRSKQQPTSEAWLKEATSGGVPRSESPRKGSGIRDVSGLS